MKYMKSILIVSAVVLAGLTLSMLAPTAAHAIAATAVQLMNTTATPVPVDEDNSARHAFTLQCFGALEHCMTNPAPSTGIPVVDFVYIYSEHSDVPSAGMGVPHTYLGGQAQTIVLPLTPSANSRFSTAAMPIKLYIDNQSSILLNTNTNGSCLFTVVGHTVTP